MNKKIIKLTSEDLNSADVKKLEKLKKAGDYEIVTASELLKCYTYAHLNCKTDTERASVVLDDFEFSKEKITAQVFQYNEQSKESEYKFVLEYEKYSYTKAKQDKEVREKMEKAGESLVIDLVAERQACWFGFDKLDREKVISFLEKDDSPTPEFWNVWRSFKSEIKAMGFSVDKDDRNKFWKVNY